jgi:GMP synthase (glutamine-hydrolysing)
MSHQKILILDFGSQVTQLIARRVREQQVYCELHPFDVSEEFITRLQAERASSSRAARIRSTRRWTGPRRRWFSSSASRCSASATACRPWPSNWAARWRVRASASSALPKSAPGAIPGSSSDIQDRTNAEGHGLLEVWMSHGDKVTELPAGFKVIGSSESCPVAAMADEERGFYAVQFHPEVTHTLKGKEMIARFVHDICGCGRDWNMPDYVNEAIARVRAQVGERRGHPRPVWRRRFVGRGGAVAQGHRRPADLRLRRQRPAAPERGAQVMETFARNLGVKVIHVDATEQFMGHLKGVSDPEPSARSSAANSSKSSRLKPQSCPTPNGWPRARSIRT